MARPARSFLSKALLLAVALALASAGLAHAGICDDGGDPDAVTGCCSNNKCPSCCTMVSEASAGDGPTMCTCSGCTGADVFVDPECTYFEFGEEPSAGCMRQLGGKGVPKEAITSVKMLGCTMCLATPTMGNTVDATCFADKDPCLRFHNLAIEGFKMGVENNKFTCAADAPAKPKDSAARGRALQGLLLVVAFAAALLMA